MKTTVFEGYTVGAIERGVPLPASHKKPLSIEQHQLLQLKDGESLVLALHFGSFMTDNAARLTHWARTKNIHTVRRKIDNASVRIWRVGPVRPVAVDKRRT